MRMEGPPPVLPHAAAELNSQTKERGRQDERPLLDKLGDLGSESASIISFLDFTREAVAEAMARLHDNRAQRVTLF